MDGSLCWVVWEGQDKTSRRPVNLANAKFKIKTNDDGSLMMPTDSLALLLDAQSSPTMEVASSSSPKIDSSSPKSLLTADIEEANAKSLPAPRKEANAKSLPTPQKPAPRKPAPRKPAPRKVETKEGEAQAKEFAAKEGEVKKLLKAFGVEKGFGVMAEVDEIDQQAVVVLASLAGTEGKAVGLLER